jgi:hypothetical protein
MYSSKYVYMHNKHVLLGDGVVICLGAGENKRPTHNTGSEIRRKPLHAILVIFNN